MHKLETLQDVVGSLRDHGERPSIIVPGEVDPEVWTYRDLCERAQALASGLGRGGLTAGTRVVLCAPNGPEWVVACCALFLAGALPVPVDAQMADEDLRHVLQDSEATWVVTTESLSERFRRIETDHKPTTVLVDVTTQHPHSWRRYLQTDGPARRATHPDDTAVLFYTSGTTGRPKGVPLTHRNLLSNLFSLLSLDVIAEHDRMFVPLPLHHVYPFSVGMLLALAAGVPMGLPRRMTGPAIANGLKQTEATIIVAVPGLYQALFAAIESRIRQRGRLSLLAFRLALHLSILTKRYLGVQVGRRLFAGARRRVAPRLRTMVSGGAALDPGLGERLEGMGWTVGTGYGLTETSPIVTLNEPGKGRLDSAGRPLPGVQLRTEAPKAGHEHGEVLVKGPNVFSGYWRLPEATAKAFSVDGYFHTGDLGELTQGRLYLAGRASSMIVLGGGENVRPDVVEEVLSRGAHIKEAAVLAVDGKLVTLVVPERAGTGREDSVARSVERDLERASRELPPHHRPTTYRLHPGPLPRTRLGKLRRHQIGSLYERASRDDSAARRTGPTPTEDMSPEDQALVRDPQAGSVWRWLSNRFSDQPISPDTSLVHDLGVDSLEWLSMTLELQESAGVVLPQEVVERMETVRDLLQSVVDGEGRGQDQADFERHVARLRDDPEGLLDETQRGWLRTPGRVAAGLGRGLLLANRLIVRRLCRLHVRGAEHVPAEGPVVWAPNHVSFLDAPALAAALPPSRLERTWWAGWSEVMFSNPVMRGLSRVTRVVPIARGRGAFGNLALGAAILYRGGDLVWFPEAARSPTGALQRFHPGIGLLLLARRVRVVPVRIDGTHQMLPPGARMPRWGSIAVSFGKPLEPSDLREGADGEEHEAQRVADALHDRVARLGAG